jgi:hypothetical protein
MIYEISILKIKMFYFLNEILKKYVGTLINKRVMLNNASRVLVKHIKNKR